MSEPTLDGIKFEYADQGQIPSIVSHLYRRHEDGRWRLLTQADLDLDEWAHISTAPTDKPIQAKIPGHGSDNIIQWTDGFMDANGDPCSCWMFVEDQEPPESWSDGVCWEVNSEGEQSTLPTHWKEVPE